MIVPSQIKKMPKVDRARERLEKAINNLALALEGQKVSGHINSASDDALVNQIKELQAANDSLYKSNKLISSRLETAISQLETLDE